MIASFEIILPLDDQIAKWQEEANAIYNKTIFYLRRESFCARNSKRYPKYNYKSISKYVMTLDVFRTSTLDYPVKEHVIKQATTDWQNYIRSRIAYFKNPKKFNGKPDIIGYKKHGKFVQIYINRTRLRVRRASEHMLILPNSEYAIKLPEHIDLKSIRCMYIHRFNGKLKFVFVYNKKQRFISRLDKSKVMGIDLGINNFIAATLNNQPYSWIIKGGMLKSINQYYHKELAKLKSTLMKTNKQYTSKRIKSLTATRNRKIKHAIHNNSTQIVDLCIQYNVGTIVIGHNKGWKQNSNLGKRTNQKFVSIPFNMFIEQLKYKAEEVGIDVIVCEEGYTSKIDHLAGEKMCHHDKYLGERIKRGLFKSSIGKLLNADINGAIGILRKINAFTDADLIGLRDRGDVVSPKILKYKSLS